MENGQVNEINEYKAPGNEEYKLYEKLIKGIAHKLHFTSGLEVEDLISEGHIAFLEAHKQYTKQNEGNRLKFPDLKPFIGASIANRLKTFITTNYRHQISKTNAEKAPQEPITEKQLIFKDAFINNKKPIIRKIYKILTGDLPDKHGLYNWLDKKLNKDGYSYTQINSAYTDIRRLLKEV